MAALFESTEWQGSAIGVEEAVGLLNLAFSDA